MSRGYYQRLPTAEKSTPLITIIVQGAISLDSHYSSTCVEMEASPFPANRRCGPYDKRLRSHRCYQCRRQRLKVSHVPKNLDP